MTIIKLYRQEEFNGICFLSFLQQSKWNLALTLGYLNLAFETRPSQLKTIPRTGRKENLKELKPAWKNKLSFRVHLDSFLISLPCQQCPWYRLKRVLLPVQKNVCISILKRNVLERMRTLLRHAISAISINSTRSPPASIKELKNKN